MTLDSWILEYAALDLKIEKNCEVSYSFQDIYTTNGSVSWSEKKTTLTAFDLLRCSVICVVI